MGKPHTTIGAERFHFRVRYGIGWFPLALAARQTFFKNLEILYSEYRFEKRTPNLIATRLAHDRAQIAWVLYGQAARAISTG